MKDNNFDKATTTYYRFMKYSEVVPFFLNAEKEGMVMNERIKKFDMDSGWNGTSFENAMLRAETGCKSCADLIRKDFINIIRKSSNWGEQYNLPSDYSGPVIDPGLLSMGIPECCVLPEVTKQHLLGDQGLDIIINAVVSRGVSSEVIRNRGIVTCTIALIAEQLGISSRIVIGITNKNTWGNYRTNDFAVLLKDYGNPLDLPLCAFWLISPAVTRRLGFSLFDAVDSQSAKTGHYFPANTSYKSDRSKQIVIDHGYYRKEMLTAEGAVKEALDTLRKHGVIK